MGFTENQIVAMVIDDARHRPLDFIEIIARCLVQRDGGIEVLDEALNQMAAPCISEAEVLRREAGRTTIVYTFKPA
jgi:hypothetical protein